MKTMKNKIERDRRVLLRLWCIWWFCAWLTAATCCNFVSFVDAAADDIEQNEIAPPPSSSLPTQNNGSIEMKNRFTQIAGGEMYGENIFRFDESPFLVVGDILVTKSAVLKIEPGVTIAFGPTFGITVNGVLQADGTPSNRITLTPRNSHKGLPEPEEVGARLVDGPTPLEGRLQIYHKGHWRSVCTNSRNWSPADYETVCQQIGYKGGRFWNWIERSPGFHSRLLYEKPNCESGKKTLFDCAWHTRQLGSGVCDYHNDIGIQCQPIHANPAADNNWRGIRFENAPVTKYLDLDNTVYSAISQSSLRYVDVIEAGWGENSAVTSAIEVIGIPPIIDNVIVSRSGFTGLNVTQPDAGFTIRNMTVRDGNGHGAFVNSSYGSVLFDGCHIAGNAADGIKYVGHDLRSNERTDRATINNFCTLPTTASATYPISVSFQQKFFAGTAKQCSKYFFTRPGYVMTVHFEHFIVHANESASVEVFDGSSSNDRLLVAWNIRNQTRLQAVTSTREKLFIRFKANMRSEVLGFIRLTTGRTRTADIIVRNSIIEGNNGRGISVDNIRSKLLIDGCTIAGNGHVSGVHVTSGAGDVNITNCKIIANNGDGVNITYTGGNRNISASSIQSNRGYGIAIWLNDTRDIDRIEFLPLNQTTVVEYTAIGMNMETGIMHGNFCSSHWINVTGNSFESNRFGDVNVKSCWQPSSSSSNQSDLKLQIGHNLFQQSLKNSIVISPALQVKGRVEFNQFKMGTYGAIYIRNTPPLDEFNAMPVSLVVQHNYFTRNTGIYVVSLGLSPYSRRHVQSLLFTRNFLRDNKITEPFGPPIEGSEGVGGSGRLNPRSRVAAVVVVSSSNVDIFRNILSNHESKYEIGSQLCDQSQTINATYNWLGHTDEQRIYPRLFHRNDRFNLAKIQYLPYLLHNTNPGTNTIISISTYVPKFHAENEGTIGGEVDGHEVIPSGMYTVMRDINIRPGGKLILQPGVTLRFEPSVAMMVAGVLEARGRHPDDIVFTLKRETVITYDGNGTASEMVANDDDDDDDPLGGDMLDIVDIETESIIERANVQAAVPPLRLLGGSGDYEGRLQLHLDGRWGTVCDYGWSITNAALVCHQLGYTLNPLDWRLHRSQLPGVGAADDVIVTNIRCTEHDTDITRCRSERLGRGEFENSCTHENDVGIRCYEGAWGGVRFSMLAERADLQYVSIEKAGLFDYATNTFRPALQMDFARHNLDNVRVVENLGDGLGIIYSDVFSGKSINNVKNCEFANNRGDGISLKQLGLQVHGSIVKDNDGSGISHNPVILDIEQKELGGWLKVSPESNVFNSDERPFMLPAMAIETTSNIDLDIWQKKYIITEEVIAADQIAIQRKIIVRCQPGYIIGIQLLNPIDNRSTESISILDSFTENTRSDIWIVKRDLSIFPATSSSYGILIYYDSGDSAVGGTVLLLSTLVAPTQDIRNRVVRGPVPTLNIRATKILRNSRGLTTFHYNRYVGDRGELYLRKANESIKIINSDISYNRFEAILINSPFWDAHESNLSEITIHVNSSTITHNGIGIRQFAKDLRSSNNLFHYTIQDTIVEDNLNGGFQVALPYVWQYNENFTHSIYFGNSTWQRNKNFAVTVHGHYAAINITSNAFVNNECNRKAAIIGLRGMEKKIRFDHNRFENNRADFIIEFRADSLSEIIGEMPAIVEYNVIKGNRRQTRQTERDRQLTQQQMSNHSNIRSAVIAFNGIQKVTLFRNLIANNDEMDYDLIAGIRSARIGNNLYATENWWGYIDIDRITARIFDFDNWNDHADVIYQPYLIEDSFEASVSLVAQESKFEIDLDNLGGRLYKDLTLKKQSKAYRIRSDITVMPGVTLTIQHGVEMEFDSNVGILVLGALNAIGYKESQIVLRSFDDNSNESDEATGSTDTDNSIRLCTQPLNCTAQRNEGFLEFFNQTTLQWVPICDHRFTLRNAQVVCRELGYDPLNVFYGHDRRIEFHTNSLTRIWSWVQPLECQGDEARLSECAERLNGQLYGHRHECHWNDGFVFVSCGGGRLRRRRRQQHQHRRNYWGGIRFANSEFEQNLYEHRFHDIESHFQMQSRQSQLEFIRIEGAGILHNEKTPAIMAIFQNPTISSVTIMNCAYHGISFIAPVGEVNLRFVNITNALGQGLNVLSLNGEGRESDESSFTPLKGLDIPYNLFSMINICDPQKELIVEERVLVYYKYDNNPVSCLKIFNAAYSAKPLGFRLLQSNLFNHSKEYGRADAIRIFDGDIYNLTSKFIGRIEADSKNEKAFYKTFGPTLSVQLIASGAPETHGFIAEVVTVPISTIGRSRDTRHNLTSSSITQTMRGAIAYSSAGEVSPTVTFTSNRFQDNCHQLYGNFSTCHSAIDLDVQNMQSFYFMNNLVQSNQGGLHIRADSRGTATSLRGYIHHNLFYENSNRPALSVEGRQSSPYQEVELHRNYFAQNNAGYEDVIRLRQVVSNFTYNFVHNNFGAHIVEVSGFEKVRLPIYQTTAHNGFYGNTATSLMGKATIVAGTAGQQYVDNVFENPDNDYEMITVNNSNFDLLNYNSTIDLWKSKIDARHNYWSYNSTISVASRIRDKSDDPLLLEVQSEPFLMSNKSILDGKCPPGWSLVGDTCFIYIGAAMTFNDAKQFCRSEQSSIPFIRTDISTLWIYLQQQMQHLRYPEKVWVQDFNYIDRCTTFEFSDIDVDNCDARHGFICEIDPKVVIDPLSWRADIFAVSILSAFMLFIILLILIGFCWYTKSKHRHTQRLQRRNSIRQSLRSLNSIDPQGSLRRRNFNMSSSTGTLTKTTTQEYKNMMSSGSIDSMEKSVLSSDASFETYEGYSRSHNEYSNNNHQQQNQQRYQSGGGGGGLKALFASDMAGGGSEFNRLATILPTNTGSINRKRTPLIAQNPNTMELSYKNEGFRDNSTFSGTRNNSMSTSITEDTPIIHQVEIDDFNSDYYGNACTLPLRSDGNESLAFLNELKQCLPEYNSHQEKTNTSFKMPKMPKTMETSIPSLILTDQSQSQSQSSTLNYDQKIDDFNFTPISTRNDATKNYDQQMIDARRRPDSYLTAVRSSKAPNEFSHNSNTKNLSPPPPPPAMAEKMKRPKTMYQNSEGGQQIPKTSAYGRSKSEALLETDFDDRTSIVPLQSNCRSYSQPLETAM